MMNNRLNKLTVSLESELNYFSRQPGKSNKNKKYLGSPLLKEPPNPHMLIQSRCTSRSSTPHFQSHNSSILWPDEEDSNEILIIEQPEEQMLILEKQERQYQEPQEEQKQEKGKIHESPGIKQSRNDKQSPIYILEEDDNLIWINEDELPNQTLPFREHQTEIKIEEEQENPNVKEESLYRSDALSQIKQLSSRQEQDAQSFNNTFNHHMPISPQTTQPLHHGRLYQTLSQLEQQYWITQDHIDNNSIRYLQLNQLSPQQEELSQYTTKIQSHSKQSPSSHQKQTHRLLDLAAIKEALRKPHYNPFNISMKKVQQLQQDIAPRTLQSISQMQSLVQNEQNFVKNKLVQQEGTINILKTLLSLKSSPPFPLKYLQTYTISQEHQIFINQQLIHLLTKYKHK